MPTQRQERINSLLQEEISRILQTIDRRLLYLEYGVTPPDQP